MRKSRKQLPTLLLAGTLALGGVASVASARSGDTACTQVQISSVPQPVRDVAKQIFAKGRDGKLYEVTNTGGNQYAATFMKKRQQLIARIDAKGEIVDEPRKVTESDLAFLKTAKASEAAEKEKTDEDTTEAQLASAKEIADKRTPVDHEDLPQPVQKATDETLKDADTIGYYKLEDDSYLIHYRSDKGKMMETSLKADGSFIHKPEERDILKASLQIEKDDVPEAAQMTFDKELADGKVTDPDRLHYFRVGEDDYALQFLNEKGRQMSVRVDQDGSVIHPLRETKKQPKGDDAKAGKASKVN